MKSGVLVRRKRIEREERDTNIRNNYTVPSDSCARGQHNTSRWFNSAQLLPGSNEVSSTISHMTWAGLLGHRPIQSEYFLV